MIVYRNVETRTPLPVGVLADFCQFVLYLVGIKPRAEFLPVYQICTAPGLYW